MYLFWCYSLILCIYSYMYVIFVVYVYWFIHKLYRLFMAERGSFGFGWGRGRSMVYPLALMLRLPPLLHLLLSLPQLVLPPPPSHPPYTQEFVMIPNPWHVKRRSQPLFPPHPSPSPPPPLGHEARTSAVPDSTPSHTPSQPGSQASSSTLH